MAKKIGQKICGFQPVQMLDNKEFRIEWSWAKHISMTSKTNRDSVAKFLKTIERCWSSKKVEFLLVCFCRAVPVIHQNHARTLPQMPVQHSGCRNNNSNNPRQVIDSSC